MKTPFQCRQLPRSKKRTAHASFTRPGNRPSGLAYPQTGRALTLALLSLSAASLAQAQSASEDSTLFGMFGQLNSAITVQNGQLIGPNACVPTATVDGLGYLYNYAISESQPAPLTFATSYTSVNNLATSMGTFNDNYYQYYNNSNVLVYVSKNVRNDAAAAAKGATSYSLIQNIGGTPTTSMFNGLQSYLSNTGANPAPNVKISGAIGGATPAGWLPGTLSAGLNVSLNTTPTAQYLANNLNAHNAVEITLEWGVFKNGAWVSQGGHEVALYSIDLANNGTGTIGYLDPWGAGGTSASGMSASLQLMPDGYLYASNFASQPADENPPDLADSAPGTPVPSILGRIDVAMIESVPEPSPLAFGLLGAAVLFIRRFLSRPSQAA